MKLMSRFLKVETKRSYTCKSFIYEVGEGDDGDYELRFYSAL